MAARVPALLIKLPSVCGHHVPARPPKWVLLIHESTMHMWLSLASSEALRHERLGVGGGGYCLPLHIQPFTKPLPRFPSGRGKKKTGRETQLHTQICCKTLTVAADACLQPGRAAGHVTTRGSLFVNVCASGCAFLFWDHLPWCFMNVEELVVYCRDLLCEYISDTQCCFGVGWLRAV